MACRSCSGNPPVPIVRKGLPTIWSWGPFADHEIVEYDELETYGRILEVKQES